MAFVTKPIEQRQRWNKYRRCPICMGAQEDPSGQGIRCFGFAGEDGEFLHCSREEHAHGIKQNMNTLTFPHKRFGRCDCGVEHDYTGEKITDVSNRIISVRGPGKPKNLNYRVVDTYTYRDIDGKILAYKERHEAYDKDGKRLAKKFSWKNADRKYESGYINSIELPPYRMWNAIMTSESTPIYYVEGERCVHALEKHKKTAICSPFASSDKWQINPLYFDRRYVYILPDNDERGRIHAEHVAEVLAPYAAEIKIVGLPFDKEKGDVVDWFESGRTIEELDRVVADTEPWESESFSALQSLTNSIRKFREMKG